MASVPSNNSPAPPDKKIEGDGNNTANPSLPLFVKGVANQKPDGTPLPPLSSAMFTTTGVKYGTSNIAVPKTSDIMKFKGAQEAAKKIKKSQGLNTDDPSAVSQDKSKNILDATMAANPNAIGHVLQKALQSMVMLKMMDKLTSPSGILSMASGGMGGALQGLAGAVGVGSMLGALNGVMPGLSASGILNGTATDTLHNGMMGMLNNVSVGALAISELAATASSVSTISDAVGAIASNAADAIDAVAYFGGPAFGLQPGSLASKIALVGPSGYVRTSTTINGVAVSTTILTSPNPHATNNIPILNGAEHVAIALDAVSEITGTLSEALGVGTVVGQALGSVSDITAGLGDISATFGNIASFSPASLGGVVNGGIAGVVDGGLNKILGVPMSGLMGAASSLLPQIGGSITGALSSFSLPSFTVPALPAGIPMPTFPTLPGFSMPSLTDILKPSGDIGNITAGLKNATKAMALSKVAHTTASNIFGQARAEAIADAVGSCEKLAAATGNTINMVTAFGDKITSSVGKVSNVLQAGQNIVGLGQRI